MRWFIKFYVISIIGKPCVCKYPTPSNAFWNLKFHSFPTYLQSDWLLFSCKCRELFPLVLSFMCLLYLGILTAPTPQFSAYKNLPCAARARQIFHFFHTTSSDISREVTSFYPTSSIICILLRISLFFLMLFTCYLFLKIYFKMFI